MSMNSLATTCGRPHNFTHTGVGAGVLVGYTTAQAERVSTIQDGQTLLCEVCDMSIPNLPQCKLLRVAPQ